MTRIFDALRRLGVVGLLLIVWAYPAHAQNTPVYPSSGAATDSTLTLATDNASTTLSGNIGTGATTLPVVSTSGIKVPVLVWIDVEEYKCLTKNSTNFTSCTAGFDGTAQTTHSSGATVSNFVSAFMHNQQVAEIEAIETDLVNGLPTVRGGTGQITAPNNNTLIGNGTVWTLKAIPDCQDSAGNHLNYIAASNSFGCGSTSGSSVIFQVDGVTLTSSSTVNFQDANAFNGLTIGFSNPSAGNVKLTVAGTLGNSGLTNSSTTVNTVTCTLGGSCTIKAVPSEAATNTNMLIADGATWNSVGISGDASVTNAGVWTNTKINGNSVATGVAAHQVEVGTAASTFTHKTIPDCIDTAGNHINFTQSSDSFSCGTSSSGGTGPTAINTGSAATDPYGPIFQFTDPTAPSYTWVNQGSATVTTTGKAITLAAPTNGSTSWNERVITAPATPYSITISFIETTGAVTGSLFVYSGLILRESGTGKFESCATIALGAGVPEPVVSKWTNETTFSAHYLAPIFTAMPAVQWLKVVDNGTNLTCHISSDGLNFVQIHTVSRTDFMSGGPNQVGFASNNQNSGANSFMNLLSWKQGTS